MPKKQEGSVKRKTTIALSEEQLTKLRVYSAAHGLDMQDVVGKLVDNYLPQIHVVKMKPLEVA
jgi:predicted DNA binding CopG/RHH family protein